MGVEKIRTFANGVLVEERVIDVPDPTPDEYAAAIQAHIDEVAKSRGYGDGVALASYVASTVPRWRAEAEAFVLWRDQVWVSAYSLQEEVVKGTRAPPSLKELLKVLPVIVWPKEV